MNVCASFQLTLSTGRRSPLYCDGSRLMDHHPAPLGLRHLEFAEFEPFQANLVHRSLVGIALGLAVGAAHLEAPGGNRDELHLGLDRPHSPPNEASPDQSGNDRQSHHGPGYARYAASSIAPGGAARGGHECGHLGRQCGTPAGAERQPLVEGQALKAGRGRACRGADASRQRFASSSSRPRNSRSRASAATWSRARGQWVSNASCARRSCAPSTTSSRAWGSRNASTNARPGEPSGNCASGAEREVAVSPVTVTNARNNAINSLRAASGRSRKTSSARRPIAPSSPPRSSWAAKVSRPSARAAPPQLVEQKGQQRQRPRRVARRPQDHVVEAGSAARGRVSKRSPASRAGRRMIWPISASSGGSSR